jgi:hypothetical protein
MHSTNLLLEEPIRMASILEPSKTVSPSPSFVLQKMSSVSSAGGYPIPTDSSAAGLIPTPTRRASSRR